jgi:hypothetical protein
MLSRFESSLTELESASLRSRRSESKKRCHDLGPQRISITCGNLKSNFNEQLDQCNRGLPETLVAKIESFFSIQNSLKQLQKQEGFLKEEELEILVYGSVLDSISTNDHLDLDLALIVNQNLKHCSANRKDS